MTKLTVFSQLIIRHWWGSLHISTWLPGPGHWTPVSWFSPPSRPRASLSRVIITQPSQWLYSVESTVYSWLMDNVTQGIGWIRKTVPTPPPPLYPWQPCLFVLCCYMHWPQHVSCVTCHVIAILAHPAVHITKSLFAHMSVLQTQTLIIVCAILVNL